VQRALTKDVTAKATVGVQLNEETDRRMAGLGLKARGMCGRIECPFSH
jgi:hypothetical protein